MQPRRSLIFTPGVRPEMYPKALRTGADIVTIDLEDAIAPGDKDTARERTLALFVDPPATGGVEPIVRVNSLRSPEGLKDILAILATETPPPAIMLPKVTSPEEVLWADDLLTGVHAAIRFHVIIETCDGLDRAYEIARASDRIDSLLFGAADMAAELRVPLQWEPLLYARSRVVHAAARAMIDVIDVPWLDLDDMDGMEREAKAAAALGFTGKGAIHPKQIPALNRCFGADPDAVAQAKRVIGAFEANPDGLLVVDGKLIEKPVLRSMYRLVALAERAAEQGEAK
ncbi:MAG: CoA ester lyase [Rhodospirillaceae bacterium]|nr:CoA ester lyase [Rhodospirillaceae bacterium]